MATITQFQTVPANEYSKHGLSKEKLREMLHKMLVLRKFEEKVEDFSL